MIAMSGQLELVASNRQEVLAEALAARLREAGSGTPFSAQRVVVQTAGIGRWLSFQVASSNSICANLQFLFPRNFAAAILAEILPGFEVSPELEPQRLQWTVLELFAEAEDFPELRSYLDGADAFMRLQLASRLARVYDKYLIHRPDWIEQWEGRRGQDNWQARLWLRIRERLGDPSHLLHGLRALERLTTLPTLEPVYLFGVSALPPLYIKLLEKISETTPVVLFQLQPSESYWGDLPTRKQEALSGIEDDYSNPLVSSLGRQGRDFLNALVDANANVFGLFQEPTGDSLLQAVQRQMFLLEKEPVQITEADASIQVASCHGPMREVEALRDYLLGCFEEDPRLEPSEVFVLAPRIDEYAPYIQAVFSSDGEGQPAIPFTIADRGPRLDLPEADALLRVVNCAGARQTSREVLALLELPALRDRFGLTENELALFNDWAIRSNIRWGRDLQHRQRMEVPFHENSWRFGMDRLLMGFATGEEEACLGIAPVEMLEEGDAEALGKLATALDVLFALWERMEKVDTIANWLIVLQDALSELFTGREHSREGVRALELALHELRVASEKVSAEIEINPRGVVWLLENMLGGERMPGGFLQGGVTFGQLRPMRTIPAKVICLLGMGEASFPRRADESRLDESLSKPRPGDPSVREADRYLFMETLLSARQKLYLSYTGQSAVDGSVIPPSTCLAQLLDFVEQTAGVAVRDGLVLQHHLQGYHAAYFEPGSRLQSFSQTDLQAAIARQGTPQEWPTLSEVTFPPLKEPPTHATLQELLLLLTNGPKFFAHMRLGINFGRDLNFPGETELLEPDDLERYNLRRELCDRVLAGEAVEPWLENKIRAGDIPSGHGGEALRRTLLHEAETFRANIDELVAQSPAPVRAASVQAGTLTIQGKVDHIYADTVLLHRPGSIRAQDRMQLFLQTAFCLLTEERQSLQGVFLGKDDAQYCLNVDKETARAALEGYSALYPKGLERVLPLLGEPAWEWVQAEAGKGRTSPIDKATKAWAGRVNNRVPLCEDPFMRLAYGQREPFDETFIDLARDVWNFLIQSEVTR